MVIEDRALLSGSVTANTTDTSALWAPVTCDLTPDSSHPSGPRPAVVVMAARLLPAPASL